MGKKGKRSKKKDAWREAEKSESLMIYILLDILNHFRVLYSKPNYCLSNTQLPSSVIREIDKLMDEAGNNQRNELFSKVANQYRKIIRLLESKKELMVYMNIIDRQLDVYYLLLLVEFRRRNIKAVIDCYNNFMAKSRNISTEWRDVVVLFHQLIMLRLSGKECQVSDFIHYISEEGMNNPMIYIEASFALRAHKMYDSAIQLEMACGSLMQSPFKSKLSLALTYLERYRVEFHKRSQMRKKDFSTMNSLITSIIEHPSKSNGGPEYILVLAQWYYLTHALAADKIIEMVQIFLYSSILVLDEICNKMKQDHCYTCDQAVTPTEVQYVCSGCRVACYCSIDHQRTTWKKEAVSGMRIGHEILCPLYKAFRKHVFERTRKDRDEEKESRMKRRFERECLNFLEYGLGLKDKCFPCEYQKQSTVSVTNSS